MRSLGKKLFLLRHGETEYNTRHIIMGQSDSPLTEKGIIQAYEAAKKVKKLGIDIIISSDLGRAVKTAEIISKETGIPVLRLEPAFRERYFGKIEGKPKSEIKKEFPKFVTDKGELILEHDLSEAEPISDFYSRVINGLKKVSKEFKGKKVLIITHKGVFNMAYAYINDVPLDKVRTVYQPDNCAIENY